MSVKELIKKLIASNDFTKIGFIKFQNFRRKYVDARAAKVLAIGKTGNYQNVFDFIYESKYWNSQESVSGQGSTLDVTEVLRKEIEATIRELKIESFLDIPCGDFNWMKEVNFGECHYIGGDIVLELTKNLNEKYGSEKRTFMHLDLVKGNLPKVDMVFIRDCFVHLTNELVQEALRNIKKSGIKYILVTHWPNEPFNMNIEVGQFRGINFSKTPFNFPAPIKIINEGNQDPLAVDKSMGLWRVSDLP